MKVWTQSQIGVWKVGGDFSARRTNLGSNSTTQRDPTLLDWVAEMDFITTSQLPAEDTKARL